MGNILASGTHTWRSTQIDQDLTLLEESILLVQLNQLERSSGPVTLLFRKPVPFIQTTFSVLEGVSFVRLGENRAKRRTFF